MKLSGHGRSARLDGKLLPSFTTTTTWLGEAESVVDASSGDPQGPAYSDLSNEYRQFAVGSKLYAKDFGLFS
jgi:hypothetical protein